ncbi:MAG: malto-oligosyltrehalose synthase [Acidobacteriota bacterium]
MTVQRPERLPLSTYRLQLHAAFTFADARSIVDYLGRLGVSDCYLSPIFASRPGSTHGYDVTQHNRFDPELGGREEYERLAAEVRTRGMGMVLDFVPNHMGVDALSNPWWRDVLENGQCSRYARFFDIDWTPLKPELEGRVLLPILGRQYGHVLEAGELKVAFNEGSFDVHYFDHCLPINPRQIPLIFAPSAGEAGIDGEGDDLGELRDILAALTAMPPHTDGRDESIAERRRVKAEARTRLQRLVERSSRVRELIDRSLREINGTPGVRASFDRLHALMEEQTYRLAYWRTASHEINYRRFFDINDLAGLRQEVPEVFETTHALLGDLLKAGPVTGVRIDHPDGLFDPEGYFQDRQQLAARVWQRDSDSRPLFVLAEKILSGDETLLDRWPIHGTTGYNYLNELNGLFVDSSAAKKIRRTYARFIGDAPRFADIVYAAKKLIMNTALASELNVLANTIDRIGEMDRRARDFTLISIRDALSEIVACFPVYRTYVRADGWTVWDRQIVDEAIGCAREHTPALEPSVFDFMREVLLPRHPEDESYEPGGPGPEDRRSGYPPLDEQQRERRLQTSMKFQQYTAPVQAKGFEDTAFYRYNVLLSLNEVGGEPDRFGRSPDTFHSANQHRFERWPFEMLATSTHDTKLGEDVRARINVISELPEEWAHAVSRWRRINQSHRVLIGREMAPDRADEYRFYQALVGAWPAEQPSQADDAFVQRLQAFMNKSIKEAKVHTSWINENRAYDEAMAHFVATTLTGRGGRRFLSAFLPLERRIATIGVVNSLAQVVLKLAGPGIPDIYQGCERWNLSLVDPDNRRPVAFETNRRMLDEIDRLLEGDPAERIASARLMLDHWQDGRIKLCLTAAGLRLRRAYPETFLAGTYVPLETEVSVQAGLVAFARLPREGPAVVAIAPRLVARKMAAEPEPAWPLGSVWQTSRILLPAALRDRRFVDVVTGRDVPVTSTGEGGWIFAGEALQASPAALLVERHAER